MAIATTSELHLQSVQDLPPVLVVDVGTAGSGRVESWLEQQGLPDAAQVVLLSDHSVASGLPLIELSGENISGICRWLTEHFPGQNALLLTLGTVLPANWQQRLALAIQANPAVTVLAPVNNSNSRLNPFALVEPGEADEANIDADSMIALAADNQLVALNDWPGGPCMIRPQAIELLAAGEFDHRQAIDAVLASDQQIAVLDSLFFHQPDKALFNGKMEPLTALAGTAKVIQGWLDSGITRQAWIDTDRPVILHVSHSWGGGIGRWVENFCHQDTSARHLILSSANPQTGDRHSLSLHAIEPGQPALRNWLLEPAIKATQTSHAQYQQILQWVIERYQVKGIIVSSLVGHSLDIYRASLPSLHVVHDYYPVWPLLERNPLEYSATDGSIDVQSALAQHLDETHFDHPLPGYWSHLTDQWIELLQQNNVRLITPSQSARRVIEQLEPRFKELPIKVQPHGLPKLAGLRQPVASRQRKDDRLRLVILGRIHAGKGRALLMEALSELQRYAQVYLLGSGKDGEEFFGQRGINVQYQYKPDELAGLLNQIGPHAGLLLSTIPETFSYTLSELQQAGIPPIATRLGSFADRIKHGVNGWLIEPEAGALNKLIASLHADPHQLQNIRDQLSDVPSVSPAAMARTYHKQLGAMEASLPALPGMMDAQQASHAFSIENIRRQGLALKQAEARLGDQARELEQRANWGIKLQSEINLVQRDLERYGEITTRLESELNASNRWAQSLDQQANEMRSRIVEQVEALAEKDLDIEHKAQEIEQRTLEIEQKSQQIEQQSFTLQAQHQEIRDLTATRIHLNNQLDQILASRSWKITKPLRVFNRLVRNLRYWQVYNPLRWPRLFGRIRSAVATVGWRRAVWRLQVTPAIAPPPEPVLPEVPEQTTDIKHIIVPSAATPLVSIIIPVYNEYPHTQACLESLSTTRTRVPFEVVVVDDASSDATPELLDLADGIQAIRNPENLGFIHTCNRGSELARGRYLVFLNNDTAVTDFWLDSMLETFDHFPDAGIVGAKLIYPDGSLQESGGIIFTDASGWNYGRNQKADEPRYLFARQVDYISGACLMISQDLFRELGRFDSHFAPAYYEDTDLSFKCRAAGKQVIVQPQAVVVHFEGASSGTDISQGTKRYQAENREKFLDRWGPDLQQQPEPIADPDDDSVVLAAADHYYRGQVLIIDAYTPEPDHDSGSVRLFNLMLCFRELGYKITFFPDNLSYAGKYSRALQAHGIQVLFHPYIENLEQFFQQHASAFDAVFVSRHYVADKYLPLVRRFCPDTPFIFDTVDLHYLREQRLADLQQNSILAGQAAKTRKAELALINQADITLVVSPAEIEVLKTDAPEARVAVVSNIHPLVGSGRTFSQRKDLYFVGGYQHPPNVDAAIWFCQEIFPLIRQQLPDVRCYLIGSRAPQEIRKLEGNGIVFKGFVQHLEPFLDGCRMSVAPLRYGAGVKGKVNMSMSHGQPVVATSIAAEGMNAEHGQQLMIADQPDQFAQAVVDLYQDEELWNRLSENGLRNVADYFSFAAAKDNLEAVFAALDKS